MGEARTRSLACARVRIVLVACVVALACVPAAAHGSWRTTLDAVRAGSGVLSDAAVPRPSSAGVGVLAAPDDDIPGVPLTPSPVSGTLDAATDVDDVYAVDLQANDWLFLELSGPVRTSFEIYLYGPGATTVDPGTPGYDADTLVDYSAWGYPESIFVRVQEAGTYYIDLYAASGSGAYSLEWTVVPSEPDDDISTCETISPSPVFGDFPADGWDMNDVFKIPLAEGDQLQVGLTGSAGADLDLHLFAPWADSTQGETPPRAYSWKMDTSSESITFLVPPGGAGDYYLEVTNWWGEGATYRIDWSVTHPRVPRIAGSNRYTTSYATSRGSFPRSGAAVLATGADYPDALAASGLAGAVSGPVLLVQPNRSFFDLEGLLMELWALEVTDVYVVGGTSAISEEFEEELTWWDFSVHRVAGSDRYSTAVKVAQEIERITGHPAEHAFLVSGAGFADALAAAPFAYIRQEPILLTRRDSLPGATSGYLKGNTGLNVHIVGGTAAVSAPVAAIADGIVTGVVRRTEGRDRYATAAALARFAVDDGGWAKWGSLGIATGRDFPDALSGGAACGVRGGPMLLTKSLELSSASAACLADESDRIGQALVFGGTSAVSEDVRASAGQLLQ